MRRFSVCAAGLFAAILIAQPALAEWKLVGVTGNANTSNNQDWTLDLMGIDDENMYGIDIGDGSLSYIRGVRNNVDAEVATNFSWTEPFWGNRYRDGQHVAYNPDEGLLYHRNGTTGYRPPIYEGLPDPRHYDTRLIEKFDPGANGAFNTAPIGVYNALTDGFAGPTGQEDPDHPIDGTIWGESRSFTWNPIDKNFILADNDGDIGYWDPAVVGPDTAVHVATNAITHRGLSWYVDGSPTGRLFSGVNDEDPGSVFIELGTDSSDPFAYLQPIKLFQGEIVVQGGPAGGNVDQMLAMAQHPDTGDLYAMVNLTTSGRHLIRFDAADIDAFDSDINAVINAQYVGVSATPNSGQSIAGMDFVEISPILIGDGNGDGVVDGLDYLVWAAAYDPGGVAADPPGAQANGDYNNGGAGDGTVDGLDYLAWAGNFGATSGSAVPEPGTFALAALALVGLLATRRRS